MKKEKKKYIFVDCDEIVKRAHYEADSHGDGFNGHYSFMRYETASKAFEESGIPDEFRIIIIDAGKLHINGLRYGEEYITKEPFISLVNTDNFKTISGYTKDKEDSKIDFETCWDYKKREDVIRFFADLKEAGMFGPYTSAVASFITNPIFDKKACDEEVKRVEAMVRTRGN